MSDKNKYTNENIPNKNKVIIGCMKTNTLNNPMTTIVDEKNIKILLITAIALFNRHRFSKIARMIDIRALENRNVVSQQL